jgi:hypothetical protein
MVGGLPGILHPDNSQLRSFRIAIAESGPSASLQSGDRNKNMPDCVAIMQACCSKMFTEWSRSAGTIFGGGRSRKRESWKREDFGESVHH